MGVLADLTWHVHEMVESFPRLDTQARAVLKESIRASGVLQPVWVWRDQRNIIYLIDGRNRVELVQELVDEGCTVATSGQSLEVPYKELLAASAREALDFTIKMNMHRRHMTSSQRAASTGLLVYYADRYEARERQGKQCRPEGDTAALAAAQAGTSRTYLFDIQRFIRAGRMDLVEQVRDGHLKVTAARKDFAAWLAEQEAEQEAAGTGVAQGSTQEAATHKPAILDATGRVVPAFLEDAFRARQRFDSLLRQAKDLATAAEELAGVPGGEYLPIADFKGEVKGLAAILRGAMPHALCPRCRAVGRDPESAGEVCRMCKGRGFIDGVQWAALGKEAQAAILADGTR